MPDPPAASAGKKPLLACTLVPAESHRIGSSSVQAWHSVAVIL